MAKDRLSSLTKPFVSGYRTLAEPTLSGCALERPDLATTGISMRFTYQSMASCSTCGAPLIRTAKCSISWCRPNRQATKKFFRNLPKGIAVHSARHHHRQARSYPAARVEILPMSRASKTSANNRAERSHQPTRERERRMRGFKSAGHAQRFLASFAVIASLFGPGRSTPLHPRRHRRPRGPGAVLSKTRAPWLRRRWRCLFDVQLLHPGAGFLG
jgi:hypothetical protein